jgi:hypothetical protein
MFMIRSLPTLVVSRMTVFLKSIIAALAVLHPALVEDLEEDLVHVGVGLLDLVEQHHAVGRGAPPRSGRRPRRSRHSPAARP